ncbi:bifunctional folylpolyglutamate synthase/dihydrofolate synthase [Lactobacillus rodentium]|uniref:tetrahydrofolate synthase n=1 Tax=Lactobacillus rodentium TaxID=947835 RepID=A0A2Z6TCV4_9LACO|nr:folylpolyglutamate synthase/dihydrofolate synthase family protein [Lactobacillus rodentium]MCR1894356.1 bifunctional folylpolyglutamate synthase/dihydrofolate synthase [Lactobacillus rodentium]GBG04655.1 folylpolyglutamate synthase [Lactobacillus rodentium]
MKVEEVISKIEHLPKLHEKNDLSYIKKVLAYLGNPQDKVKTIHVTGTNGKGSTSYYIANLLKKAGKRTGLFVSPYISKFNERIQINLDLISDKDLIKAYQVVTRVINKIKETDDTFSLVTFEFETVMAFWLFAEKHCDYAVIEVGIGGQHDKTNVITPEVSVITSIGLDHEDIIGPTIEDIAKEKSGIIKKGRPVVFGEIAAKPLNILINQAKQMRVRYFEYEKDYQIIIDKKIKFTNSQYQLSFNLRSPVEAIDMGIAVEVITILGLQLKPQAVEQAINETVIPGRYQIISRHPEIILDGAHNIQAISNLVGFVREQPHHKLYYLMGMMKDKDLDQVFTQFRFDEEIVLTRIDYPRAAEFEDFPEFIRNRSQFIENYQAAFDRVKEQLGENDILIVTGSFYLVGAILNYWEKKDES